ncbi:MAG TPA: glycosyltransferase family 2 protein, partial [Thermoleophilaceae bacterium]|nr:glycosyltransferase family 2 protein [Thermoleophilaceae bacterium]
MSRAEQPEISVAIASHNRRDLLRSVLSGLAAQTYPADRYEVVAVLDGSTDGSAEMAGALEVPYRLRVITQPQRGLAASRNRGLAEATHPLVVFLDDDLVPVEGFVEAHAAAHGTPDPHVVVGHSPPARIGTGYWAQDFRRWWEDRYRRLSDPGHRWSFLDFADGNFSTPAEILHAVGGWDEGFSRRQDWELAARLLDAGTRFAYCPDATGWHHFDSSLGAAFAYRRAEGASDIPFAERHPRWRGLLQLARLADIYVHSPPRRRLVAAAYRGRWYTHAAAGQGLRVLAVLERLRLHGAWSRVLGNLMTLHYLLGVRDALPSLDAFTEIAHAIADERPERVTVDLDRPGPAALPDHPGPLEVCVTQGERVLACVPGTRPMQQWDWGELVDRLIDAGGEPLA